MKSFLAALALLLPSLACAQEEKQTSAPSAECVLCKLPNRAALFAGTARKCPPDCAKLCCTGTEVTYLVEGLVCINCSSSLSAALSKLDGVHVEAACHNTGQVLLKYAPAVVKSEALVNAIIAAGHPVTGEKASFHLPTMTDDAAATVVERALSALKGVLRVATSVGNQNRATVIFDPSLTTRDQVATAINKIPAKVGAAP